MNLRMNGESQMIEARNLVNKPNQSGGFCQCSGRRMLSVLGSGVLLVVASTLFAAGAVSAQTNNAKSKPATEQPWTKIGFVNTQRILRDSPPAKAAQDKIEKEFDKRNKELQQSIADFRKKVQQFEKDAPVLTESDRNRRQRELGNVDAEIQRKQREIQEDFNRRRNEEFAIIIEKANLAIKQIAEKDNYDLILQDAVTVSARVDITDKVIKALGK